MKQIRRQQGQSLMEAIVAIAILLMVVIAILALTISGVTGQKESEQQVVANNLAREGIELVRNLRDTNWINGDPWNTGLEDADNPNSLYEGTIDYLSTEINYSFVNSVLGLNSEDFYAHDGYVSASPYSRVIRTQDICFSQFDEYVATLGNGCLSTEQKIGLKVTSLVTWQNSGDDREVKLEDLLYDWK